MPGVSPGSGRKCTLVVRAGSSSQDSCIVLVLEGNVVKK